MKMPSVMRPQHGFAVVPKAQIERSQFDRSHGYKTTFDAGWLIPVFVDEALPGDTFNVSMQAFTRLATPLKPVMDNLYLDTFFFAVPYRLVWTNFVKMMGEQVNPGDSTSYTIPQQVPPAGGYTVTSLEDYFGLPLGVVGSLSHSTLWRRAYYLIYNQWFRDENLINSVAVSTGDGPDVIPVNGSVLVKRGKRHDYFTSCLPWPQKGTAVSVVLSGMANVKGIAVAVATVPGGGTPGASLETGGAAPSGWTGNIAASSGQPYFRMASAAAGGPPVIQADLGSVSTPVTINSLRQSFQIQKMLERDARGGTRYTEMVRAHFGVTSPDARLQRAEYLGGGTSSIQVSPVAQTTPAAVPDPEDALGNLAGIGTGVVNGHGFVKSFTEHCLILGLVSVRSDLTYQQGMERMFSRLTRYDHYFPALAHLGEQSVLSKEIYADGTAGDADVFGYQERYAEYRYKPSRITGLFRSNVAGTLDVWHLSQDFGARPTLGQTFIEEDPPVDRVIAVPTQPQFLFDAWFNFKHARPMPTFSVPGLIDHF